MAGVDVPSKPINRKEQYLAKIAGQGTEIPAYPITREEAYLNEIAKSGGGGTTDYEDLENKPQIGGVELSGNKSLADLDIASAQSVSEIKDGQEINSFADVENALSDKADNDIVADAFSAAATYAEGDYCTYEGGLYKFKTAHEGAWDAADVDRIQIAGELSELKNTLTCVEEALDALQIKKTTVIETTDSNGIIESNLARASKLVLSAYDTSSIQTLIQVGFNSSGNYIFRFTNNAGVARADIIFRITVYYMDIVS